MSKAWSCIDFPETHGAFLQSGLDTLSAIYGALQPRDRYGCPRCIAEGKPGWLRPSTHTEAGRLLDQQEA